METLATKSLLLNLVFEHDLIIDSLTTDRSSDMKTMMRWVKYGSDVSILLVPSILLKRPSTNLVFFPSYSVVLRILIKVLGPKGGKSGDFSK